MLDQMDEEFGIGELLKEEEEIDRRSAYTEKDLRGLRVEHDIVSFTHSHKSTKISNNFPQKIDVHYLFISFIYLSICIINKSG